MSSAPSRALEKRRFEPVRLFDKNLNNSEIGRRLKVSNQTVSRWRKECKEGGNVALRGTGRAGRLPCLDEADRARLGELLLQGPERLSYETPLWTCPRVADLIERNFEVAYHPGHVWRILRQLNCIGLNPALVVIGTAAKHVLIHHRDGEDVAEEVDHLLWSGQIAQVAMDDDAVKAPEDLHEVLPLEILAPEKMGDLMQWLFAEAYASACYFAA